MWMGATYCVGVLFLRRFLSSPCELVQRTGLEAVALVAWLTNFAGLSDRSRTETLVNCEYLKAVDGSSATMATNSPQE